jgi:Cys-rich protein (TIGR01571 family)
MAAFRIGLIALALDGVAAEMPEMLTDAEVAFSRASDGVFNDFTRLSGGRILVFVFILALNIFIAIVYYKMWIVPTQARRLMPNVWIREELRGRWFRGLFECRQDLGTCCCASFFMGPTMADLWFRAGFTKAVVSSDDPCQSFFGSFVAFNVFQYVIPCVFPCALAALRGGAPRASSSHERVMGVTPLRGLFHIDGSFLEDCLSWAFCAPCTLTQEYNQVKTAIDSIPDGQQVAMSDIPGSVSMVPMAEPEAMMAGQQPMGQPMQQPMEQPPMGP